MDRKEHYKVLEEEHSVRMTTKSPAEQYQEKASWILTCVALTKCAPLDYIEESPNGEKSVTTGSTTKKKNGWFRVDLVDNREFCVQEADLYNEKRYRLYDNKFKCSEKIN